MVEFDDKIPQRDFDNFQFVNFTEFKAKGRGHSAAFALAALMEVPGSAESTWLNMSASSRKVFLTDHYPFDSQRFQRLGFVSDSFSARTSAHKYFCVPTLIC